MSQVVPDTVKLEMRYSVGEQSGLVENVYYVGVVAEDEATLDNIKGAALVWEDTDAKAVRSDECSLVEIVCTGLGSLTSPRKVYPVDPAVVGTVNSPVLPPNVTVAIHATTILRGRGKSGRKFWIGLAENQVAKATLLPGVRDPLLNAVEALRGAMLVVPGSHGLVIPHFVIAGLRPGIVGTTPVIGFTLTDVTIDSQKLRLPNHKKHKKPRP